MLSKRSMIVVAALLAVGLAIAGSNTAVVAQATRLPAGTEIPALRTDHSRTFSNGNGSLTTEIQVEPTGLDGTGPSGGTDDSTNVYPNSTPYHTGTVKGNNGNPTYYYSSWMWFKGGQDTAQMRAWARFNTSSVPDGATIDSLTFFMHFFAASSPKYLLTQMAHDPISVGWPTVYNDIGTGAEYAYGTVATQGYHSYPLPAQACTDFGNQLLADWFAIGIRDTHSSAAYFGEAFGWDSLPVRPYIAVKYTPLPVPEAPTPLAPANGCTLTLTYRPTLEVTPLDAVDKYRFRVFAGDTLVVVDDSSATTAAWTVPSNLANNTDFTWECRAKNLAGWGDWFEPRWAFRIAVVPPDTFWGAKASVPSGPKAKNVKDGGCLTYGESIDSNYVYALKGNGTCEFYRYNITTNHWVAKESIPAVGRAGKKKGVKKGAAMTSVLASSKAGDSKEYAAKGNGTLEFYDYPVTKDEDAAYAWTQRADIPAGAKTVKEGAGTAAVKIGDTNFVYLLKGSGTQEFYRYNTRSNVWISRAPVPLGPSGKPFKNGSCLARLKGSCTQELCALKGSVNEFFAYDCSTNLWVTKAPLPFLNRDGKKKKAKDGAGLASYNGYVYCLKGGNTRELWKYQIDSNRWAQIADLPTGGGKNVKGGGALTYAPSPGPALFAFKGNNTLEFYKYGLHWDFFGSSFATPTNTQSSIFNLQSSISNLRVAPNPFSDAATIAYSLARPGNVSLKLYDVTGKLVNTLTTGYRPAGAASFIVPRSSLASGIYLLKLETDDYTTTNKLIIE